MIDLKEIHDFINEISKKIRQSSNYQLREEDVEKLLRYRELLSEKGISEDKLEVETPKKFFRPIIKILFVSHHLSFCLHKIKSNDLRTFVRKLNEQINHDETTNHETPIAKAVDEGELENK
ncbi:hypothetical protein SNEBB_001062 [Seison nebaliae]|nr:hypothetical protein SNEBB_001062 [Seison nebaliae]